MPIRAYKSPFSPCSVSSRPSNIAPPHSALARVVVRQSSASRRFSRMYSTTASKSVPKRSRRSLNGACPRFGTYLAIKLVGSQATFRWSSPPKTALRVGYSGRTFYCSYLLPSDLCILTKSVHFARMHRQIDWHSQLCAKAKSEGCGFFSATLIKPGGVQVSMEAGVVHRNDCLVSTAETMALTYVRRAITARKRMSQI